MAAENSSGKRLAASFVLGAASLLVAELVVLAALAWPAADAIAGTPHANFASHQEPEHPAAYPRPEPQEPAPIPTQDKEPAPEQSRPAQTPRAEPKPEPPLRGQRPGTIKLPGGGTASLIRKEVTGPDALLPVPENLREATWWGSGLDAPSGASVFAGHVNWKGSAGPFAELWNDKVNQQVTVVDDSGKAWNYRITQAITLHKDELPTRAEELFNQDGPHRIVLVTCGGHWQGGTTGYADNRVVIAEPMG